MATIKRFEEINNFIAYLNESVKKGRQKPYKNQ